MKKIILLLTVAGCSSKDDRIDESDDAPTPNGPSLNFPLHGTVSDPLVVRSGVRIIVGVARPADLSERVQCDKLVTKSDLADQVLPSQYELTIPTGDYVLLAIVLPAGGRAPVGIYPITVDGEGVHYKSPNPTSSVNITIQGTMPYDCP